MGWINEEVVIRVVGAIFVLTVVEDDCVMPEKKEVCGGEWEERSSGGSGEEEVVGPVLGVDSEADDASPRIPTQVQLGEETNPRSRSTSFKTGQKEGQESAFVEVQELVVDMGINVKSQP
jgi:hypothetical protein